MSITRFKNKTKVADIVPNIEDVLNAVYPVGSIAFGTKPTVGTWEKIEGRFLLGSSSSYKVGSTGGEATHKLTTNEMPSHNHTTQLGVGSYITIDDNAPNKYGIQGGSFVQMSWGPNSGKYTGKTGGSRAHNNMPPYIVVDMWKRIA